jgi:hypothetical protein
MTRWLVIDNCSEMRRSRDGRGPISDRATRKLAEGVAIDLVL